MQEETIASISTPLGRGAIAIVRMSGKDSLIFAQKVFHCKNEELEPRYLYFGKLELGENEFEECLMVYFKAPFSYTGEDVVEFQIHGGVLLAQKVLDKILSLGVRLAEPGEFSKRAFLNGKITLDKAEAIIGEINAESEAELKNSLNVTNGKLAEKIGDVQESLKYLLAEIEVGLDYPDETEETAIKSNIFSKLQEILQDTNGILDAAKSSKFLTNGISVALVGKTNVGKSSIMNALLGKDRSIVTNIKGTTRDSVSESFVYKGIKINLIDTAGIRETKDVVENLGIEKSKEMLRQADIVLFILDGSEKESPEDREIEKLLTEKNVLYIINKTDMKRIVEKKPNEIEVSALSGKNINALKEQILKQVKLEKVDLNKTVFVNERQNKILEAARNKLIKALDSKQETLDVFSMMLKDLWLEFGKITGKTENEDIIDLIFSKFCLGK